MAAGREARVEGKRSGGAAMTSAPQFRHFLVQSLWELVQEWTTKEKLAGNPIVTAIWYALRRELPDILRSLDENDAVVEMIRERLAKVLQEEEKQRNNEGGE